MVAASASVDVLYGVAQGVLGHLLEVAVDDPQAGLGRAVDG